MKRWHTLSAGIILALLALGLFGWGLSRSAAAISASDTVVPMGPAQPDVRTAYHDVLAHLYGGGRVHWAADAFGDGTLGLFTPGDFIIPEGLDTTADHVDLTGTLPLTRAYALQPLDVAVLRSSARVGVESGDVVAMWEIAEIRQTLDGYLLGAAPYDVLTETGVAQGLSGYDLLIVPAFRSDARDDVLARLDESGALTAIEAFVARGGTLYAQGSGIFVAEAAGALPEGTVDPTARVRLAAPDAIANRGRMEMAIPDDPLAYGWLTDTLYILDDPLLHPSEGTEVVAQLVNLEDRESTPAVVRHPHESGQVIGVVGHPTDPTRRSQVPLFMDALLSALAGRADFHGDAIQTFNPDYPPHEFPAYERVPVSATLNVENLWDAPLSEVVVTETVAPGYVLTGAIEPTPALTAPTEAGGTQIVWTFDQLAAQEVLTLSYRAVTSPTALAAGVGTFSRGQMAYTDLSGKRAHVAHRPFVLTARMAARLVGDRDLEADRHFNIPAEGVYLDVALPLENKEETLASSVAMTDWVYLIAPIVDYADQHAILSANDGETVWMRNEPYLWEGDYPAWEGAAAPTETITLDDWRALPEKQWCVFTSAHGIHTDPPSDTMQTQDLGSFVTIPPTYTDAITVTADDELLLPCYPLTFDLGDIPGYWYEEPGVRYGVHSRELFSRTVVFHGTPREDTVVLPHDTGSVYVAAGTETVPFRQHLKTATPYHAPSPTTPKLSWQDVWSRTHTTTFRATFYDVWDWDSCATCGGEEGEQHAGLAVTFGLWIDTDGDGEPDKQVKEIPTRLDEAQLRLLGKTYSANAGGDDFTIPSGENLIELPIFKGLGIKIGPQEATWYDSWRGAGPGSTDLITVSEQTAYDHLFFQQEIPPGSWASFIVSATIENYPFDTPAATQDKPFNREGLFKLHDGGRLVYRQPIAGPNRYEVYDAHVHAAEGWSSDGAVAKRGGPTAVSIYSDTVIFLTQVWDEHDPRAFDRFYDPYLKSWGYGDLVWSTYVGGREEKTLFHSILEPGDRTRVRVALDNNTGLTLTNLSVDLAPPAGLAATPLYTDPETAPEPIWPELSFLNRETVPDAWRSVWYFDLAVGDVPDELWGEVLEVPVEVSADNLPAGYEAPPARIALRAVAGATPRHRQRPEDATPTFVSGPAHDLVLTDAVPANVRLDAAALVTDTAIVDALRQAMDADAGHPLSDTAGALFASLAPTVPFTSADGVATFELPAAMRELPSANQPWYLVSKATLIRAQHGPNVVNDGPTIHYTDTFGLSWQEQGEGLTVEAHGAAIWVDYYCNGGWGASSLEASREVASVGGSCFIPDYGPSEIVMDVTAYNAGDAVARGVTVTLTLPDGVTVTESTPPWAALDDDRVTWNLGDLAPGAWRQFEIVFRVEPRDEGGIEESPPAFTTQTESASEQMLAIHHTTGEFWDDYSGRVVQGRVGDDFWLNVVAKWDRVYLPLLMRDYLEAPDLVVESVAASLDNVQVVVSNQGNAATAEDFWVDAYVAPDPVPTAVNQLWPDLADEGIAWGVIERLQPGEIITLTVDGAYYHEQDSAVSWPLAAGTEIYAQVDSWNPDTDYGTVLEDHEIRGQSYENNIGHTTVSDDSAAGSSVTGSPQPFEYGDLPARE